MSVKAALAKLSATAAGGALLAGGAVHVAEKPVTDAPSYKSAKGAKTQPRMIKQAKATPRATRPAPPPRAARVIPRQVECVPASSPQATYQGANVCPPVYRAALAPVPVPPLPEARPLGGGGTAARSIPSAGGGFGGGGFGGGGSGCLGFSRRTSCCCRNACLAFCWERAPVWVRSVFSFFAPGICAFGAGRGGPPPKFMSV